MSLPVLASLIAFIGYVAGATPFGYMTARFMAGIDIRKEGSGNIGATNIGRVLGAKWGALVLLLDCLKGWLPVFLTPLLLPESAEPHALHLQVLCGILTVVGHMFPFWLRFNGGKGVATALGVVVALSPWATLAAFGVFVLVVATWRIMSLGSLSAAVTYAVVQMLSLKPHPFAEGNWSLGAFSLLVPALIFVRHRSNIGRLLRGEEKRFEFGGRKDAERKSDGEIPKDNPNDQVPMTN